MLDTFRPAVSAAVEDEDVLSAAEQPVTPKLTHMARVVMVRRMETPWSG
jgi:hypothetical protein